MSSAPVMKALWCGNGKLTASFSWLLECASWVTWTSQAQGG